MFNAKIISFSISNAPTLEDITTPSKEAIERTSDCKIEIVFHSEQGWGYQVKTYTKQIKDNNIILSMYRKGNCLDN